MDEAVVIDPHRDPLGHLERLGARLDPLDHPLAEQEVVSMTDLTDEDWIAGCERCRANLMANARSAGFTPQSFFDVGETQRQSLDAPPQVRF